MFPDADSFLLELHPWMTCGDLSPLAHGQRVIHRISTREFHIPSCLIVSFLETFASTLTRLDLHMARNEELLTRTTGILSMTQPVTLTIKIRTDSAFLDHIATSAPFTRHAGLVHVDTAAGNSEPNTMLSGWRHIEIGNLMLLK